MSLKITMSFAEQRDKVGRVLEDKYERVEISEDVDLVKLLPMIERLKEDNSDIFHYMVYAFPKSSRFFSPYNLK